MINHIANRGVCIVLTNSNLLGCETCNYYSMTTFCQGSGTTSGLVSCLPLCRVADTSYQGHYVVACGYDLPRQKIVYRNPSLDNRECVMSFQQFEEARTSYGTDDDVIFVDMTSKASDIPSSNYPLKRHSNL